MSASHANQLRLRKNTPGIQDGTGCGPRMVQSGQNYREADVAAVADWLDDRAAGYPLNLTLTMMAPLRGVYSDEEGATWKPRTRSYLADGRPVPPVTLRTRSG